jgi:hypothetical protein
MAITTDIANPTLIVTIPPKCPRLRTAWATQPHPRTWKEREENSTSKCGYGHCQKQWKFTVSVTFFKANSWIRLPQTSRKSNYDVPAIHR